MTRYRIVPYLADQWAVDRKWLCFWLPEYKLSGPGPGASSLYDPAMFALYRVSFFSVETAEAHVRDTVKRQVKAGLDRRMARVRKHNIPPREYP